MTIPLVLAMSCLASPTWDASVLNEELNGQGWNQDNGASVRTDENVISIWRDERGGDHELRLRVLPTDGSSPTTSVQLTETDTGYYAPAVVTGPSGEVLVCWENNGFHGVWVANDGSVSESVINFETTPVDPNRLHSILINHDGNVVMAWRQDELYSAVYSPKGALLHGPTLFGPDEWWDSTPDLALQSDNSILASFTFHDGTYLNLPNIQLLDQYGQPDGLHQVASTEETIDSDGVQIYSSDDGKNLLAWYAEEESGIHQLYMRTTDSDGNFLIEPTPIDYGWFTERSGGGWIHYWLTDDEEVMLQLVSSDGLPQAETSQLVYANDSAIDDDGESFSISELDLRQAMSQAPGELVLTWKQTNDATQDEDVYCRTIDSNGEDNGPIQQASDDTTTSDQDSAAIAPLPGGGFVAVWREQLLTTSTSQSVIYMRSFDSDGLPTSEYIRVQDELAQEYPTSQPIVRSNADGVTVAWIDDRESFGNIYLQRFDLLLQHVGSNVRVTTWDSPPFGTGTNADSFDLAISTDGTACCAFDHGREDNLLSYVRMISSDGTLSDTQLVSTSYYNNYNSHRSHVVALSNGLFGVAYVYSAPTYYQLSYRTYDASGNMHGSPQVIEELTSDPLNFEFTVNDDGHGLLAWSHDDDSSLYVIELNPSGEFSEAEQIDTGSENSPTFIAAAVSETNTRLLTWSEVTYYHSDAVGQVRWEDGDIPGEQLSYLEDVQTSDLESTIDAAWLGDTVVIAVNMDQGSETSKDAIAFLESSPCPADVDGSGSVDVDDVLALIGSWGSTNSQYDLDDDGLVEIDDLLMVLSAFNCSG